MIYKQKTIIQKISYPKSVLFIVCNEFCERFSFYGLRTILAIYLNFKLGFSHDTATVIYHVFIMFCYFFPLLGAILADSWLGKFRTIFYLSLVYALGNIVVSVAAVPDLIPPREFTMLGLILIALGTGGIKPCVSAFGGDQFVLPQQEKQLQKFFSLFYFAINSGSLLSTFLTPILREDVKCFDDDSCYSLAFGVPAVLMIVSLVIFLIGKKWYKLKKPEGNVILEVVKCIWYAATKKVSEKREHWLHKADDRFDRKFIEDIRMTLRVLVLFIPLPIFWALFDQQGSRWTFQATRMDVDVGIMKIKPDQMQVVNPVLILVFIPIFESVIYPLLAKCNLLKKPLQRLTVGGLLAAAAFGVSAIVESQLEETYPILPGTGEGQLRLFNGAGCNLTVSADGIIPETEVPEKNFFVKHDLEIKNSSEFEVSVKGPCWGGQPTFKAKVAEKGATSYALSKFGSHEIIHESVDKSVEGDPKLMIFYMDNDERSEPNVTLKPKSENDKKLFHLQPFEDFIKIAADEYLVIVSSNEIGEITLKQGGNYALLIQKNLGNHTISLLTVAEPNSVNILFLLPQYIIITAGEVMFSITGLEFSFTQAPVSMKSLLQAVWLLTVAIGNLVVVIIAEAKIFSSQMHEFLLFGGLMVVDMFIFALMAMKYTYVSDIKDEDNNQVELKSSNPEDTVHM